MKLNIDKFYSFFRENTKVIFIFLIIVGIHFYWIHSLNERAQVGQETKNLYKIHHEAQAAIGSNLMSSCDFFKNEKSKTKLQFELSRYGLDGKITKKKMYELRHLSFTELKFKSFLKKNHQVEAISLGYLVENTSNSKCFGIM